MYGILCTLSPKRLAQIVEEPDLVEEIVEAISDEEIPGSLELQKAWHALDLLLCDGEDGSTLSPAMVGRGGQAIGPSLSFSPAHILSSETVQKIAAAFAGLSPTVVADRYDELAKSAVHGGYGGTAPNPELPSELEKRNSEIAYLNEMLADVVKLYRKAADDGHSMLVAVV